MLYASVSPALGVAKISLDGTNASFLALESARSFALTSNRIFVLATTGVDFVSLEDRAAGASRMHSWGWEA